MPVGPYPTFAVCVASQRRRGKGEEAARRICGAIEAEQDQMVTKTDAQVGAIREMFSGLAKVLGTVLDFTPQPAIVRHDDSAADDGFRIKKFDDEEQIVFGWGSVSMRVDGELLVDRQGDIIEPEVLEKAAYAFVLDFRESGVNHEGPSIGRIAESMVFTPDKLDVLGLKKDALPVGWWVGIKIDDQEVYSRVKKGDLPMFSIQGTAEREAA